MRFERSAILGLIAGGDKMADFINPFDATRNLLLPISFGPDITLQVRSSVHRIRLFSCKKLSKFLRHLPMNRQENTYEKVSLNSTTISHEGPFVSRIAACLPGVPYS